MSRVLVIDFETANISATSACAIGAILIENNEIVQQYFSFIKPPSKIFQFSYIHGITWEKVKDAPTFKEMWEQDFSKLYESANLIVGHNIQFDARVMKATAEHHQINLPSKPTECTVKLARQQLKISPAKLNNVCDVLNIPLKHHEALSDSLASAYIYLHAKTGEKPWLLNQAPKKNLTKTKNKIVKKESLVDTISSMNSEKTKALLATLLKK